MKIIDVGEKINGSVKEVADADIVIENGQVVKDRWGRVPRPATEEEKRKAKKIR